VNESIFSAKFAGDIITITPKDNAFGVDIINITLCDSDGAIDWQHIVVELEPVNDPPVWMDIKDIYLNKYSSLDDVISLSDHLIDIDGEEPIFKLLENTNPSYIDASLDF